MRILLLLTCLAVCVPVCFSQSDKTVKPDLTGTWEFKPPGNKGAKTQNNILEQVKITHHDPELILRYKIQSDGVTEERALTYYTDGRGETNTTGPKSNADSDSWQPDIESTTTWSEDKVVIRSVKQSFSGVAIFVIEIVDEWKLSSDGNTLIRTTTTTPKKDVGAITAAFVGDGKEHKTVFKLISK
jgi:hypothetical protein